MVGKLKFTMLFVAVIGLTCLVLNFSGMNAVACAHDGTTCKSKECYHGKDGKCSIQASYKKKSKCSKSGGHDLSDMMKLTQCAKKELLKEKIKANLEKKMGSKLDKIADLLVDAMLEEYKSSMEDKGRKMALENNIREVFSGRDEQ